MSKNQSQLWCPKSQHLGSNVDRLPGTAPMENWIKLRKKWGEQQYRCFVNELRAVQLDVDPSHVLANPYALLWWDVQRRHRRIRTSWLGTKLKRDQYHVRWENLKWATWKKAPWERKKNSNKISFQMSPCYRILFICEPSGSIPDRNGHRPCNQFCWTEITPHHSHLRILHQTHSSWRDQVIGRNNHGLNFPESIK